MDDKSFVNLISDDVLNEIKIDTRLKAPFKRVVKNCKHILMLMVIPLKEIIRLFLKKI